MYLIISTSVNDQHISMLSVQLCYSVSCHLKFQGKQLVISLLYTFYCLLIFANLILSYCMFNLDFS